MVTIIFFFLFSFLTFVSLCSLSPVSNFFYLLLLFSILLPLFPDPSKHSPPITFSVFLASISLHFLGLWSFCQFFFSQSFHMTSLFQPTKALKAGDSQCVISCTNVSASPTVRLSAIIWHEHCNLVDISRHNPSSVQPWRRWILCLSTIFSCVRSCVFSMNNVYLFDCLCYHKGLASGIISIWYTGILRGFISKLFYF